MGGRGSADGTEGGTRYPPPRADLRSCHCSQATGTYPPGFPGKICATTEDDPQASEGGPPGTEPAGREISGSRRETGSQVRGTGPSRPVRGGQAQEHPGSFAHGEVGPNQGHPKGQLNAADPILRSPGTSSAVGDLGAGCERRSTREQQSGPSPAGTKSAMLAEKLCSRQVSRFSAPFPRRKSTHPGLSTVSSNEQVESTIGCPAGM
jgi:hypothetical protein